MLGVCLRAYDASGTPLSPYAGESPAAGSPNRDLPLAAHSLVPMGRIARTLLNRGGLLQHRE